MVQPISLVFLYFVQKYLACQMYVTEGRNLRSVGIYTFWSSIVPSL